MKRLLTVAAVLWLCWAFAAPAHAGLIKAQAPCSTVNFCLVIQADNPATTYTVRSFRFTAPGPGTALVYFTGSMLCQSFNQDPFGTFPEDIFDSQIVTSATAVPNASQGGLREQVSFPPFTVVPDEGGFSNTFSLATTQSFVFSKAGSKTFYFRLNRLLMTASSRCLISDGAFSVVFEPTSTGGLSKGQGVCKIPVNPDAVGCVDFDSGGATTLLVRSFAFTAPRAGTALAIFTGSMVCLDNGLNDATTVVDLVSQITTVSAAVPDEFQPGGLRHAVSWPAATVLGTGFRVTFNLASERAVTFTAPGTKTFYFKLTKLRMDVGNSCFIQDAAFTVIFE